MFAKFVRSAAARSAPIGRRISSAITKGENRAPTYTPKRYGLDLTILTLGFIPIFTFGLGTWQLSRLKWKVALIDELEEKLLLEPIPLPNRINMTVIPEFIYRKVLLKGRWDHPHSMSIGPRVRNGTVGYHIITPLIRRDGTTILVDRGFVSSDFGGEKLPEQIVGAEGEVEVLGMIRESQARNNFTPDNHPDEGVWHWADIEAMTEFAGGVDANVQPVFIEEIFEGHTGDAASRSVRGIPIGRAPTVDLRNAHLSYVITWYSLSALTSVMMFRLLLKRKQNPVKRLPR